MYIETLESFIDVIYKELAEQKILGVDIENSNKSYEGYISLIQISYHVDNKTIKNCVFDMLAIFKDLDEEMKEDMATDFLG